MKVLKNWFNKILKYFLFLPNQVFFPVLMLLYLLTFIKSKLIFSFNSLTFWEYYENLFQLYIYYFWCHWHTLYIPFVIFKKTSGKAWPKRILWPRYVSFQTTLGWSYRGQLTENLCEKILWNSQNTSIIYIKAMTVALFSKIPSRHSAYLPWFDVKFLDRAWGRNTDLLRTFRPSLTEMFTVWTFLKQWLDNVWQPNKDAHRRINRRSPSALSNTCCRLMRNF